MRGTVLVLALAAWGALPVPARADTPARCIVLGQMSVSTWLSMLSNLSTPDASTLDQHVARLDHLTGVYGSLACDTDLLGATMDCVLDRAGSVNDPRFLARACMDETGLSATTDAQ